MGTKWTRETVKKWLKDYSQATLEFARMEPAEKLQILGIIRSEYPDEHSQAAAIDAQIARVKRGLA